MSIIKAYIIRIELKESHPKVWRKIVLPAGATYRRLHDMIQYATNFKDNHLYEFRLEEENRVVTNNEEAYLEHQYFKKNRKLFEEQLKNIPKNMRKFEEQHQSRLNKEVRKPSGLKIDDYLETYRSIDYVYDYGDNWEITIILEDIVEDYYFGYPILLDGAGTAPPEDIGGVEGYHELLRILKDPNHPDYHDRQFWINGPLRYRAYDPNHINRMLKTVHYKKTEWHLIDHDNYTLIEDKYRKE
ncbi:plasmid pRiA4b ORF-3 family protein [Marinilactibacillus kalidii]|uniref:plasmid pRiA4b ORF-3 family protein n=1 Tax=Marinilactibacillus kalidii TaxID=2820274 RepID=UPI001ABDC661|nr:plasmid pRiA4b ORF-3 family protein [Marinilactibacillus kalidii]